MHSDDKKVADLIHHHNARAGTRRNPPEPLTLSDACDVNTAIRIAKAISREEIRRQWWPRRAIRACQRIIAALRKKR